MTHEEAIKAFKPITDNEAYTDNFQDACKMAIEALKKQIPKKPELKGEYYVCSVCGVFQETSEGNPPYCINCGQAIGWEEEE